MTKKTHSQGTAKVLVVDDEPGGRYAMDAVLQEAGLDTVAVGSGKEALAKLDEVGVVLTDLSMPEMDGLELLKAVQAIDATISVVLITARGSERTAVAAMKAGAVDYLSKPFDNDELTSVVLRALELHRLRNDNRRLSAEAALGHRLVAESPVMRKLVDATLRVAGKDVTVLVRGETGTGKELVGSMLHMQSHRASGPLVRFNCAALPPDLAEAELFGHAKGAFTGATASRAGYFRMADKGTLILDEVGELPLAIQAKLLRAIQQGEVQSLGVSGVDKVDVRIVACTNRDLAAEVAAKRFREDLYYRLAVIELVIPPLRERSQDVRPLVLELVRAYRERFRLKKFSLSEALIKHLETLPWPGNVRQLENVVARLAALTDDAVVGLEALDLFALAGLKSATSVESDLPRDELSLPEQIEILERSVIASVFAATGRNQSETARRLAISRSTLIEKMKRYNIGAQSDVE